MTDIIITSEHRVGSRWMHYLLADLYGKKTSPELDKNKILASIDEIQQRLKDNKIVKFHHAIPEDILGIVPGDYKVIGMVRNPRDRAVSFAFHNKYHKSDYPFKQKEFKGDFDAVKWTVLHDKSYLENTKRQFLLMVRGLSTKKFKDWDIEYYGGYIWTTYEWMKEDTFREISIISKFLGEDVSDIDLLNTIKRNSFKAKARGRSPGEEIRGNLWRRKGVVGDFINWFDEEMMYVTEEDNATYEEKVFFG